MRFFLIQYKYQACQKSKNSIIHSPVQLAQKNLNLEREKKRWDYCSKRSEISWRIENHSFTPIHTVLFQEYRFKVKKTKIGCFQHIFAFH